MAASSEPSHPVVLLSTTPSEDIAKTLARGLVEKKMVACCNLVPKVTSIYWWDNAVNEDTEILMVMKTQSHLVAQINDFIKANHPYDVPELISMKIEDGNDKYIQWISHSTKKQ